MILSDKKEHDDIYKNKRDMIVDFVFDESVVQVFSDMIRRSVPGYEAVITQVGLFARQYAQANSNLYDLGCSTGAVTLSLLNQLKHENCKIISVDNAPAMIERCKEAVEKARNKIKCDVDIQCDDINNVAIENASVVVINFTLQFLAPEVRQELITRIYNGMNDGAILIVSEKISFNDDKDVAFHTAMHLAYKSANHYSDIEISQKRAALEKVLIPDTQEQHFQRFENAGFSNMYQWFQSFNFCSYAAVK